MARKGNNPLVLLMVALLMVVLVLMAPSQFETTL
jgi:hypothetical protein